MTAQRNAASADSARDQRVTHIVGMTQCEDEKRNDLEQDDSTVVTHWAP